MSVAFYPLEVEQGASLLATLQWLGGGKFMAAIEDVEPGYPTVLTVTGHGLNSLSPHPVLISGCQGLAHINSSDTEVPRCTRIDDDRFEVPRTTVGEEWEFGTGEITYWIPTGNIESYSAVLNVRKNWHSSEIIHTSSTANGELVLNNIDGSTTIHIPATATALWRTVSMVYDIDYTLPASPDIVQRVFRGTMTLRRDI